MDFCNFVSFNKVTACLVQANTVNQIADDKKRNIFLFLSSAMTKREKYSSQCHRCTLNVGGSEILKYMDPKCEIIGVITYKVSVTMDEWWVTIPSP